MRISPAFVPMLLAALLAAPAHAEGAAPKHKQTQSQTWVSFEPMYATIVDADRPCGMLLVEIGLDIPDAALRETATHALPILRDYYIRSLTTFSVSSVRTTKQPDVTAIAERLQRVTDKALKKKGARVLLAQVAIRLTR